MQTETHEDWHSTHQHWNHARSSTISARHCADKHIHCCSSACGTDNRWSCPHYGSGMHTRLYAWYLSGASRLYPAYSKRIHGIVRFCDAQMQSESKAIMSTSKACEWVKALTWALTPQDCLVCWMDMYFNRMLHEYHPRRTEIGTNSDLASHITKRFASATGASIASLTGQINKPQQEISRRHH